jgi:hypothetical protein
MNYKLYLGILGTRYSGDNSEDIQETSSNALNIFSYLRYKCKKLSFIARMVLKYERGTSEYFKGCECNKGSFYTYVLQHFV